MIPLYVILPGEISTPLSNMIKEATIDIDIVMIKNPKNLPDLRNKKILFAVELNRMGVSLPTLEILDHLYSRGDDALFGSTAGIFIHSHNELFTKSAAKDIIFLANQLGCDFPGHPMVEATRNFNNLHTWTKQIDLTLEEICYNLCRRLVNRLMEDTPRIFEDPKLLVLHSSSHNTSNSLMLWDMVKKHLSFSKIEELHVENGTVLDCKGCSYKTCMHYSKQNSCFYGGFMIEEVLPAIEKSDAILWICPNYNDSVSANLMAVINRLTTLYRKKELYDKTIFSIIVSGNSGSDAVAKQLIDALNINKGLRLPPYFALMATANDPGSINSVSMIEEEAEKFANTIIRGIKS